MRPRVVYVVQTVTVYRRLCPSGIMLLVWPHCLCLPLGWVVAWLVGSTGACSETVPPPNVLSNAVPIIGNGGAIKWRAARAFCEKNEYLKMNCCILMNWRVCLVCAPNIVVQEQINCCSGWSKEFFCPLITSLLVGDGGGDSTSHDACRLPNSSDLVSLNS